MWCTVVANERVTVGLDTIHTGSCIETLLHWTQRLWNGLVPEQARHGSHRGGFVGR